MRLKKRRSPARGMCRVAIITAGVMLGWPPRDGAIWAPLCLCWCSSLKRGEGCKFRLGTEYPRVILKGGRVSALRELVTSAPSRSATV